MIPSVFVSSTVLDLHHLRDGIRDGIIELGYNPVMSEHGEIGYLPYESAPESCYLAMRDCQLAVLLVGKRYGVLYNSSVSVTQNEFRAARSNAIPTFALVDRDVLAFSQVHAANPGITQTFPGMDDPERTFAFLQEIKNAPVNNAILPFVSATDARALLKRQLAHYVGDLLRRQIEVAHGGIGDVLSEIKTLRHEIRGTPPNDESLRYLRAMQFLLGDTSRAEVLLRLAEGLDGTVDKAVPSMLAVDSFDKYLSVAAADVRIVSNEEMDSLRIDDETLFKTGWGFDWGDDYDTATEFGKLAVSEGRRVQMNAAAHRGLRKLYEQFLNAAMRRAS